MFYPIDEREEPLGEAEIDYLNAAGARVFQFANALRSDMHGHLSNRILEGCASHGVTTERLMDIMGETQQVFHDEPPTQDEAVRYLAPFFKGDEQYALAVYTHIKFISAVGLATLAHGLDTLMLTEPGDPTVKETMQDLHDVLKDMKYGDWEIRMMQQRFTQAFSAFNDEYLGKGQGRCA
ncbi:MAG: hypothetical protein DI582_06015 [Azospirillum brasilense]|nr:MAG: hypothetical protein DI582_06015 [Azospirillum brasilense]